MYEGFYGLRRSPFAHTPDPNFLFLTDSHRDAAAGLTYAILARKGFSVLTGDAGTGKTTLLRSVMGSIPTNRVQVSCVLNPVVTTSEFLEMAMADFGIATIPASKSQRLAVFQQFLLDVYSEGKIAVLVVDEAHRLTVELLEEIRLLTNFETDRDKLLQIILAGQDEMGELLDRHELRQLKQRIAIRLHIRPLTVPQVAEYIQHRWYKVSEKPAPFTAEAMKQVAHYSSGVPRVVNSLCDNALLLGFAKGNSSIHKDDIIEVAADLHLGNAAYPLAQVRPSAPPAQPQPQEPVRTLLVATTGAAGQAGTPPAALSKAPAKQIDDKPERIELQIPKPAPRPPEANPIPTLNRYQPARSWRVRLGFRMRGVEG